MPQQETEFYKQPLYILAVGVGGAAVILAVLAGLAKLVPALATAVGLGVAVSVTGLATAGGIAAWVAPLATVGVAATGAGSTVYVTYKIAEKIRKEPYDWAIPILAVVAGFMTDLSNEFYFDDDKILKAIFSALTGVMMLLGGYLVGKKEIAAKIAGVILPLLVPAVILIRLLIKAQTKSDSWSFQLGHLLRVPLSPAMGVGGILLLLALVMIGVGGLVDRSTKAKA